MRRFISFAVVLFFSIPLGVSLSGCHKAAVPVYCNSASSGVQVGQLTTLDLEPRLTGISLNQGAIGQTQTPTGTDCKGNTVSPGTVTYGYFNSTGTTYVSNNALVDIEPTNGRLCAGTWNRNSGGGIADFTYCTAGTKSGISYITASAQGVSSNPIPVYVHPVVTSIVLGPASTNCSTDPASNCNLDPTQPNGCAAGAAPVPSTPVFSGNACVSQGQTQLLIARAYENNRTDAADNISCQVGPLSFSAQNAAVAILNASSQTNGQVEASQPGSTVINAAAGGSQAASSAGFFSTCPPVSITLTTQGSTTAPTGPVTVNQNVSQNLVVTAVDQNDVTINNLQLTFQSTNPQVIPSGSTVTPTYPGAAAITAVCEPATCNGSSFNQIGLLQNGTPVFSNPVNIVANGTGNANVLYVGSTNSQFLLPIDFTQPSESSLVRLPYQPTSMVISEDGTTIYMGSSYELMVLSTTSNALTKQDSSVSGNVLSVSPSGTNLVVTDPVRNLIYIYATGGGTTTQYGGTATSAQWSPDSDQVYITTTDGRLLVYSSFTGWIPTTLPAPSSSVAVTIPSAGAYLGSSFSSSNGTPQGVVTGHSICPQTTVVGGGSSTQTTNVFYPLVDNTSAQASSIVATNDGRHILGASPTTSAGTGAFTDVSTNTKAGACTPAPAGSAATGPVLSFTSTTNPAIPFTGGVTPSYITTTYPQSPQVYATSDSAYAFVTYTGTGGAVPEYNPATKVLTNIPLQKTSAGTPVAPVAGAVSTDNQTFYVGSSGDNLVHILTRGTNGFTDSTTPITPSLPASIGSGNAVPNLLVLHPRKSNS